MSKAGTLEVFPRSQSILVRWVHFCVGSSGPGATDNLVSFVLWIPGLVFHYGSPPPISFSGPFCSSPELLLLPST